MARDLREFIQQMETGYPDDFIRVEKEVDPSKFEVTAILEHLDNEGRHAMVLFEKPLNLRGGVSEIPLLINVFGRRERCAVALDFDPQRSKLPLSLHFSELGNGAQKPAVVENAEAPVKEVIMTGSDIDTRELPIVIHSEGDYGPCLTMALAVRDPESGAYNASFIKAFYD